jgi:Mn-dependent DtxR family transcriptional regulator
MGERLPQEVNQFLVAHIDSVEQLEALILMSEDPGRAWTAAELSKRLKTSPRSVEVRLALLVERGLLQQADETFAYTATGVADRRVRDLAWCFRSRRTAVIEAIFTSDRDVRRKPAM